MFNNQNKCSPCYYMRGVVDLCNNMYSFCNWMFDCVKSVQKCLNRVNKMSIESVAEI